MKFPSKQIKNLFGAMTCGQPIEASAWEATDEDLCKVCRLMRQHGGLKRANAKENLEAMGIDSFKCVPLKEVANAEAKTKEVVPMTPKPVRGRQVTRPKREFKPVPQKPSNTDLLRKALLAAKADLVQNGTPAAREKLIRLRKELRALKN